MSKKILCLFLLLSLFGCSVYYKHANDKAVENLNEQIKNEKFAEIYDRSSNNLKANVTKSEFIEKMKLAVSKMKELDENLNWQKDESVLFDKSVFHDRNFSYRAIKNGDKKIGLSIDWQESFAFCGFAVFWEEEAKEKNIGIRSCD